MRECGKDYPKELIDIKPKARKRRFYELDFLRGFCVIMMMIDHFFFSSADVLPMVWEWCGKEFWAKLPILADVYWFSAARGTVRYVVVFMFMLLCGISCTLSRSNLQRGVKALLVAAGITIVTAIASRIMGGGLTIYFGVIHMLACSMLIYWGLSLAGAQIKRIGKNGKYAKYSDLFGRLFPAFVGLVFLIIYFANWGHFEVLDIIIDPKGAKSTQYFPELVSDVMSSGGEKFKVFLSLFVEIKNGGVGGADYFPLIPCGAIVLIGSGFGELVYKNVKEYPSSLALLRNEPVSFIGRHGLFFYVGHQIVILVFFFLVGLIV